MLQIPSFEHPCHDVRFPLTKYTLLQDVGKQLPCKNFFDKFSLVVIIQTHLKKERRNILKLWHQFSSCVVTC